VADQARTVRTGFARFEDRRYRREWTPEEVMLGLVGDWGDHGKLVQGKAGVRDTADLDTKLGHELADCLWAILTLADCYAVNREAAFSSTKVDLHRWLAQAKAKDASVHPD